MSRLCLLTALLLSCGAALAMPVLPSELEQAAERGFQALHPQNVQSSKRPGPLPPEAPRIYRGGSRTRFIPIAVPGAGSRSAEASATTSIFELGGELPARNSPVFNALPKSDRAVVLRRLRDREIASGLRKAQNRRDDIGRYLPRDADSVAKELARFPPGTKLSPSEDRQWWTQLSIPARQKLLSRVSSKKRWDRLREEQRAAKRGALEGGGESSGVGTSSAAEESREQAVAHASSQGEAFDSSEKGHGSTKRPWFDLNVLPDEEGRPAGAMKTHD